MHFRLSPLFRGVSCLGAASALTVSLHAQLVADGATNTLSNTTNAITGNLTIGTNGSFTLLVLSDNCLLTNSGFSTIGANASAKSNEVRLVSSTARWQMGGNLFVGSNGAVSRLVVSNGALLENNRVMVGNHPASSNNEVVVSGPGSTLNSPNGVWIGADGNSNRLTILNGGQVSANLSGGLSIIGFNQGMKGNAALVADAGSRWSLNHELYVGSGGNGNTLVVSNGALVDSLHGRIGSALTASNNLVIVTGAGSAWSNNGVLRVGDIGPGSQLIVSNGGTVFAGGSAYVGLNVFSISNRVTVDGGTLRVTNATGTGVLDVRRGTNVLNAGLVEVDQLLVTNTAGKFELNGGTLSVGKVTASNGQLFRVGNGVSPATLNLTSFGTNSFGNGLTISANAALTGMKISKNRPFDINSQIQVAGTITYGGPLIVTNLEPGTLAVGDRFQLFSASSYAGAFSSVTLPPLGFLQSWTNKLLIDGSIEVVGTVPSVYITARPSPTGTGPNPNGYLEFFFTTVLDSAAKSAVADAPPRDGSRAVVGGLPDTNSGFLISTRLPVRGAVYQLDHTFTSAFGNINTDAVFSVSCNNGTLSVNNTDKFQARYGTVTSWRTIGYVTNNPHDDNPLIEFRYESGFINGSVEAGKRLNLDCFRFSMVVPRPQISKVVVSGEVNLVMSGFGGVSNSTYAVLTSTNIVLPITNWIPIATNQFDRFGNFIFTNAIAPGELQRYFRIRIP
ncbi:MAG TPA: hypothetical protein VFZ59_08965 [Verrucomicrobiae bacterium]|nr:hypothetical protein [Verrucomicrobiae bacterium]